MVSPLLARSPSGTTMVRPLTTGSSSFDPAEGALDQGFYADITFGIDW